MKMDDANDDNSARVNLIEHAIGKPLNDGTPKVPMYQLALKGTLGHSFESRVHLADEVSPEPRSLQLIPASCRPHIGLGWPTQDQLIAHSSRKMSSRTFVHASTSSEFASWSSIRASSSWRWA